MSTTSPTRKKPGRRSTVATHHERAAIELALARGVAFERVGQEHGLSRMALHRHWFSLSAEHRARLAELATDLDATEARTHGIYARLAALVPAGPTGAVETARTV